ncbi:MAG: redoxin family protein [Bacteroidetes bacterium]|nr:redoxin family protein [Bacteroidota bacterium]
MKRNLTYRFSHFFILFLIAVNLADAKPLDVTFSIAPYHYFPDPGENFKPDTNRLYQFFEYVFSVDTTGINKNSVVEIQFSNEYYKTGFDKVTAFNIAVPISGEFRVVTREVAGNGEILQTRTFDFTPILPQVFDPEWRNLIDPPKKWNLQKGYKGLALRNYIFYRTYLKPYSYPTLTDLNGNILKPEDCKGKVLYFNIFQIGCVGCVMEVPFLDSIQNKFKDDVVFVGFALQPEKSVNNLDDAYTKMVREHLEGYFLIIDPKRKLEYELFGLDGTPSTVIVDKSGKVRWVHSGYGCDSKPNAGELKNGCINSSIMKHYTALLQELISE